MSKIKHIITSENRSTNVLNKGSDRIAFVVDKEVYIRNMYNNAKLEDNSLGIFIGKDNPIYDTIKKEIEKLIPVEE